MFEIVCGVLMVLASMAVADWRCRRWRQQLNDHKQIADEWRTSCVTWQETAEGWKESARIWRDVAQGRGMLQAIAAEPLSAGQLVVRAATDTSGLRVSPTPDGDTDEAP